ncbi:hypothetical protein [Nitratireductor thuwali]|uniref:Uncharacterized protein n=1 Tax=Nitratireductor thuwali TaxID=2267699 RepID=A0ABY5MET9_9HYPH|nr:hypothetical protein NTH_00757 [Nitratireductor thuwali]
MDKIDPRLREMVKRLGEALETEPSPVKSPDDLFAPPPWPRAQMNVMFRVLAGDMDLPSRCPDRRCRRTGDCRGGIGGDCEACVPLWSAADLARLEAAWLALALAWSCETERHHVLAAMLGYGDRPAGAWLR